MTPDKIYFPKNGLPAYIINTKPIGDNDICYIRKDALVEWLNNRISDGDEEGLMTNQIANFAYKDVIDKLNSL